MSKKAHHELQKYRLRFPSVFEAMNARMALDHKLSDNERKYLKECMEFDKWCVWHEIYSDE